MTPVMPHASVPAFASGVGASRPGLGLSTVYISPFRATAAPAGVYRPAVLRVPEGGGMVGLKGPSETRGPQDRGNKGSIATFTSGSRRNLIWTMGKIDRDKVMLPHFNTLTYGREFPTDGRVIKRHLDLFHKRRARRFPGSCAIWKMELQKRGAAHFHLMVFGVERVACKRRASWKRADYKGLLALMKGCDCPVCWTQRTWHAIAGYSSFDQLRAGTRVEEARTWAGVASYTYKYLGKVVPSTVVLDDTGERVSLGACGRWWGVSGRRFLPVNLVEYRLTPSGFYTLRRYARRIVQSSGQKKRDRGRGDRGLAFWVSPRTLNQFRSLRH